MAMTPPGLIAVGEPAPPTGPAELYRQAKTLERDAFARAWPFWFLVPEFEPVEEAPEAVPSDASDPSDWDAPTGVTHLPYERQRAELGELLFAVRKVQDLYPDMITIGRTANHDIALRDPSVSKFHAHFRQRAGIFYLIDADSRFGTTVDGLKLPPRRPILVVSGARVGIGALHFRFVNPDGAHDLVHGRR